MSIHFDESLVALWFVAYGHSDILLSVNKSKSFEGFYSVGRFRTYHEETAWGDKDGKEWFGADHPGLSREEVIAVNRTKIKELSTATQGKVTELVRDENESFTDFLDRFKAHDFVHIKPPTAEEKRYVH